MLRYNSVLATVGGQGSPGLGLRVPRGSPPVEKHQKSDFQGSLGVGLKVPGTLGTPLARTLVVMLIHFLE